MGRDARIGPPFAPARTMTGLCFVLNRTHPVFASSIALACLIFGLGLTIVQSRAETRLVAAIVGMPQSVFDPRRDACDGHDVPDAPLRAYRDTDGMIRAFGLHYENRRLSGRSLLALKVDCPIVFRAGGQGDPAAYDDRSWITATWTEDGRHVSALVHHEFQAHRHAGRCRLPDYMACWWNTILGASSTDGGASFQKSARPVLVATPFRSEVGQGRHRGFFNPSNIVRHEGRLHVLIGTTGWSTAEGGSDQPGGVCLFQSVDIKAGDWRAFDGTTYQARFPDPYSVQNGRRAARCQPIAPFPAPVGSVVKHRPSGLFLAVFQAKQGMPDGLGGHYARSGFFTASSKDLVRWSPPQLLMETRTLYDDACGVDALRSYPVLIDEGAKGRNFDDAGDSVLLFYSEMRISGCDHTSERKLVARKVRISPFAAE